MSVVRQRAYQSRSVKLARAAVRSDGRALLVLATGLGKTITSALVWKGFLKGKGLFLVHNNGILNHAMKEYKKVFGEAVPMAFFNGRHKDVEGASVVFATVQSMSRSLDAFDKREFAWMTVDETHHAQAESWRATISHFECPRLGVTATPNRMDRKDIRELFGQEADEIGLEEAIVAGWLPMIRYSVLADTTLDNKAIRTLLAEADITLRKPSLSQINKRIFISTRDDEVARRVEEKGMKAVVFCNSIHHAETFVRHLRSAATYHSKKHWSENEQALADFRSGKLTKLLVVDAFNEGMDVPDIELVVFCRNTYSETIFRQQLGRGLRPGKHGIEVMDFVNNFERVLMLKKINERMKELGGTLLQPADRGKVHLKGRSLLFEFDETLKDLIGVYETGHSGRWYSTWEEAAIPVRAARVRTQKEYEEFRVKNNKLPPRPNKLYADKGWPGWNRFLDRRSPDKINRELYETYGSRLPTNVRDIVDLHLAGVTNRDISRKLSISYSRVQQHLGRAAAKLKWRQRDALADHVLLNEVGKTLRFEIARRWKAGSEEARYHAARYVVELLMERAGQELANENTIRWCLAATRAALAASDGDAFADWVNTTFVKKAQDTGRGA